MVLNILHFVLLLRLDDLVEGYPRLTDPGPEISTCTTIPVYDAGRECETFKLLQWFVFKCNWNIADSVYPQSFAFSYVDFEA